MKMSSLGTLDKNKTISLDAPVLLAVPVNINIESGRWLSFIE